MFLLPTIAVQADIVPATVNVNPVLLNVLTVFQLISAHLALMDTTSTAMIASRVSVNSNH